MRRFILVLAVAGISVAAVAAGSHPFSVHDMLAMDRIADPQVSPDGKLVAFSVSVTDMEANRRRSDIFVCSIDGSGLRRLACWTCFCAA